MATKNNDLRKRNAFPYFIIAPALLLIIIFKLYPIVLNIWNSFQWKGEASVRSYELIFADKTFWKSLWTTFKFTLILTPLQIVISIGMSLLVCQRIRGVARFRTIYYLPVTISITVACIMWNMMLNPSNGVVNSVLMKLGMEAQPFFTGKDQALESIMLVATWKGCGYWMMFLLAGINDIDTSIYEAAKIDGSSYWNTVFHITLPLLKKQIAFGTLLRIVIAPVIGVGCAILFTKAGLFSFGSDDYAAFVALFGSPIAVSSAVMAAEMHNDEQLAGQLVVWTSIGSVFTVFVGVVILKSLNLL